MPYMSICGWRKRKASEATPCVGGVKALSSKIDAIYGHMWVGQRNEFQNHAPCGRGRPGSSSKQAIYGRGKGSLSETMPQVGGARRRVPASKPYMDVRGRGRKRRFTNHASSRWGKILSSTHYAIRDVRSKASYSEPSRNAAKQSVAEVNAIAIYQRLTLLELAAIVCVLSCQFEL